MPRFSAAQSDLFAPQPAPRAADGVALDPLAELEALFGLLRDADAMPWPDVGAVVAEERRALGLARLAGPRGEELARAIMDETERLFCIAEAKMAAARG